jgi:putative membrane protein
VRPVYWLAALVVALAVAVIAANTGERVQVILWPFLTLEAPLYLVALVPLLLGFLMGALIAWVGGRHWRRAARRCERRIESLERELGATQARLPHGNPSLPA